MKYIQFQASVLFVVSASLLISSAAFAGPKGKVTCRHLGSVEITVDGDFSDWPLGAYEQRAEQSVFPGARDVAETDASGDHIVFDKERIGLFNGTPNNPLTFADGPEDFDSVVYVAWSDECLYFLEVRVDEFLRDDRNPGNCVGLDVGNDGFSIFIDAKNDSLDCATDGSFPTFDTGAPNSDDFEMGCGLHNQHRLDTSDPNDVGARQHMERHGTTALIDSPCPSPGSYRSILDALGHPDIAARSYADLGAAGALNPVIVNNPEQTFSGYALEVCVPFGFFADFDPSSNPVMGFELFWHEADLCRSGNFGCSDGQNDPGTGGNAISWATWTQSTDVPCNIPQVPLFQTSNWGEIIFDDTNPLGRPLPTLPLPPITASGLAVPIVDIAQLPNTNPGGSARADTNILTHAGDGSGRVFVNDMRGTIYIIEDDALNPEPFLDLTQVDGVNLAITDVFQGFTFFTFHADFANPGTPGHRKLYTATDEDPVGTAVPSRLARIGQRSPAFGAQRVDRRRERPRQGRPHEPSRAATTRLALSRPQDGATGIQPRVATGRSRLRDALRVPR